MKSIELMRIIFFVFLVSSVYTTDDKDFGNCKPLEDPVGSHPMHGGDVRAGFLLVIREGTDIVARAFCDEEQGFLPAAGSFPEMRCSWNEDYKEWTWSHYHHQRPIPAIRCARISPKPILQKYSLGLGFTGCDDEKGKQAMEGSVREYLSRLPCAEQQECIVTEVSCLHKTIAVIVKPASLHNIEKQKRILESSVHFLKNFQPSVIVFKKRDIGLSGLEDVVPEITETSDCAVVEVVVGDNCIKCPAGFFANLDNGYCEVCPLDSYSTKSVNVCTACETDKGTLSKGSAEAAECIDICEVPDVKFINNVLESRVAEDSEVDINCQDGYTYGNLATAKIICSGSGANFPASCRKLSVSVKSPAIKSGDDAVFTCSSEATDVGTEIVWYRVNTALSNGGVDYTIVTTIGTAVETDGMTIISTSTLTINAFDAADEASYSCTVDYALPILDDSSDYFYITILDVTMEPSVKQIKSAGEILLITCSMDIDNTYSIMLVSWSLAGAAIISGITTSTEAGKFKEVLTLTDLSLDAAGTYTCEGKYSTSNGSNEFVISKTLEVVVRGFTVTPSAFTATVGSTYSISCTAVGDQEATMYWIQTADGIESTLPSGTVTYLENEGKSSVTLELAMIAESDAGDYQCQAVFESDMIITDAVTIAVHDMGIETDPISASFQNENNKF